MRKMFSEKQIEGMISEKGGTKLYRHTYIEANEVDSIDVISTSKIPTNIEETHSLSIQDKIISIQYFNDSNSIFYNCWDIEFNEDMDELQLHLFDNDTPITISTQWSLYNVSTTEI